MSFTQNAKPTQGYDTQAPPTQPGPSAGPTSYKIGGVTVEFPAKAYPSQVAMMAKVIDGLKRRQNCLLESPTGSGKSLALLCSALAWQRYEADRVKILNEELIMKYQARQVEKHRRMAELTEKLRSSEGNAKKTSPIQTEKAGSSGQSEAGTEESSLLTSDESGIDDSSPKIEEYPVTDDEDDFQPKKRSKKGAGLHIKTENNGTKEDKSGDIAKDEEELFKLMASSVDEEGKEMKEKLLRVPRIFFGTRTHKQIAQITRELRKTVYRDARTVILASREHTCVNTVVQRLSNKNDACQELLDSSGMGCEWFNNSKKLSSYGELNRRGLRHGFDLEDIVQVGRDNRACPYFISRNLMMGADLIFCPYNYIIDPLIRESMKIDLKSSIVIFDEAHNMEDASREASAVTLLIDDIQDAMQDFEKIQSVPGSFDSFGHGFVSKFLSTFAGWISDHDKENILATLDFETSGRCWTGIEAVAQWSHIGMTEQYISKAQEHFVVIAKHREEELMKMKEANMNARDGIPMVNQMAIRTTEQVFRIFSSLNKKFMDDYRVAVLKQTVRQRQRGKQTNNKESFSINLWCLNPAIAFEAFQETHSVVLTSGTLSPIRSFESELGAVFPIKLEASHVIDPNQVLVGMIGAGPEQVTLNGSYRSVETFNYQDELGRLVLQVCTKMPFGVLCFLPSYRLMDKLIARWEQTGLWTQLKLVKRVLTEPRTGAADFEEAIQLFYEANSGADPVSSVTGGLFFAVCRGKVSEGLDFADNNARAVICVGIPFPNFKDLQVEMKREYNNKNMSRGLLPGMDWYEIQAFRALNQALGRCIRHRNDWGAILLVDDRFIRNQKYTQSLSKWVRSSVRNYTDWTLFENHLERFREEMFAKPIEAPAFQENACQHDMPASAFTSKPDDDHKENENNAFKKMFFGFGTPQQRKLRPEDCQTPSPGPSVHTPSPITSLIKPQSKRPRSNW